MQIFTTEEITEMTMSPLLATQPATLRQLLKTLSVACVHDAQDVWKAMVIAVFDTLPAETSDCCPNAALARLRHLRCAIMTTVNKPSSTQNALQVGSSYIYACLILDAETTVAAAEPAANV